MSKNDRATAFNTCSKPNDLSLQVKKYENHLRKMNCSKWNANGIYFWTFLNVNRKLFKQ